MTSEALTSQSAARALHMINSCNEQNQQALKRRSPCYHHVLEVGVAHLWQTFGISVVWDYISYNAQDKQDERLKVDRQDELLKEAEELARHMSTYQHYIPPNITAKEQILEDAKEELVQQCEDVWGQIQECQSRLMLTTTETLPESDVQLHLLMTQVKALHAEYEQWQKRSPEIISKNQDVLLASGKEELEKTDRDLEMMLSSVRAKNKELQKDLEKEQYWMEGQQQLVDALTARLDELKTQATGFSEKRVFQDLADKLVKVRAYKEELLTSLGVFLEEHFPLPVQEIKGSKKKPRLSAESTVQWITLHEILEILINKMMSTPHDPYVVTDQQYWPPYIEMLLRYGIALRHPEDSNRIRLEAFHQ
ncbi:centromere protein K [Pelodytes ibericus]